MYSANTIKITMLHLFAVIYFLLNNILVQTSKQIGRRNMFVAAIFLHPKNCLVQWNPAFARPNTLRYFDIEQAHKKILPFVTQFQPALKGLNNITNGIYFKTSLISRDIVKEFPLISYGKGKSLKCMLVKAKL